MRIAVEGCGHGTLDAIYASIEQACQVQGWEGIDLLIIGGDFQAVRNAHDLNTMSVPIKYQAIGDFRKYYSGERVAPYLTLFVGGNHEASSHLQELYYGGWVAPNIYYMGAANVLRFGGLRIAGLSGIWKGYNYQKPHFERLPYDRDEVKSLYHVREIDVRKLLLLRQQVDIGISHDWPRGIEWHGDHKALFRQKDLFEADSKAGTLGSVAAQRVMDRLRPAYWFSAHLHCKFSAIMSYQTNISRGTASLNGTEDDANDSHTDGAQSHITASTLDIASQQEPIKNDEEIDLDLGDDDMDEPVAKSNEIVAADPTQKQESQEESVVSEELRSQLPAAFQAPQSHSRPASLPHPDSITNTTTHFLALDKCLPHRKFLQLLHIDDITDQPSPAQLTYDPEWLSILRVFAAHDPHSPAPRDEGEAAYMPQIAPEREWIKTNINSAKLIIPQNFTQTAPIYDGRDIRSIGTEQPPEYTNPQTSQFCALIGIPNFFDDSETVRQERHVRKSALILADAANHTGHGYGHGRGQVNRGRGGGRGRFQGHGRGGRGRGRGRGYH